MEERVQLQVRAPLKMSKECNKKATEIMNQKEQKQAENNLVRLSKLSITKR